MYQRVSRGKGGGPLTDGDGDALMDFRGVSNRVITDAPRFTIVSTTRFDSNPYFRINAVLGLS